MLKLKYPKESISSDLSKVKKCEEVFLLYNKNNRFFDSPRKRKILDVFNDFKSINISNGKDSLWSVNMDGSMLFITSFPVVYVNKQDAINQLKIINKGVVS